MDATSLEKAAEFKSAQTSASFCTLDIVCKRIFLAFSSPCNTSVFSLRTADLSVKEQKLLGQYSCKTD
jgi:hypothetical protein